MSLVYGTSTSLTLGAASLASAAAQSSAAVTSSAANISAIMLSVNVLTTATAPSGNKQVLVYAYMSEDGSTYTGSSATSDNVDGTNKAVTIGSPSNLKFVGTVQLNQGAVAQTIREQFELVAAFGCVPRKWGIVLYNDAGTPLGATVTATYTEQSNS